MFSLPDVNLPCPPDQCRVALGNIHMRAISTPLGQGLSWGGLVFEPKRFLDGNRFRAREWLIPRWGQELN